MIVYIDILLFVNAIVNYAVLMTSEKLLKRDCRLYRMIGGAFTGSLFSLLIFVTDDNRLLLFGLKLLSTALITLITFGARTRKEYGKACVCTLGVSVVYCGFFILFYQMFKPPNMLVVNDVVYFQVDPMLLIALTVIIYLIILLMYKLFSERIKATVVPMNFTVDDHRYSCTGKIDTGCSLKEPFSSSPVIITDPGVFHIADNLPCRIVPYTALNNSSYLKAVKAQKVNIDKKQIDREIYIAVADVRNNDYQAIINSEIVR